MPKLILKFEDRILREISVGQNPITIGRLPDNAVVIDNPAVSGHHARLTFQGNQYLLEDLESLNGTFVNEKRVTQQALRDGDIVQVGKHRLVFEHSGQEEPATAEAAAPAGAPVPDIGGTVFLDTKAQKELMAKLAAQAQAEKAAAAKPAAAPKPAAPPPSPAAPAAPKAEPAKPPAPPPPPAPAPAAPKPAPAPAPAAAAPAAPAAAAPAPAAPKGYVTVLSGSTDRPDYRLEAQTVLIGKSKTALIRLKGWFKPDVAAAITRKGAGYVLTPVSGKIEVNHQPVTKPHDLQDGDLVQVSGVTLQFNLKS